MTVNLLVFVFVCFLDIIFNLSSCTATAWYDAELEQYQKERQDTELESFFQERQVQKSQQGEIHFEPRHKQPSKEPEPEWQRTAKEKRGEDYYSKLRGVRQNYYVIDRLQSKPIVRLLLRLAG